MFYFRIFTTGLHRNRGNLCYVNRAFIDIVRNDEINDAAFFCEVLPSVMDKWCIVTSSMTSFSRRKQDNNIRKLEIMRQVKRCSIKIRFNKALMQSKFTLESF